MDCRTFRKKLEDYLEGGLDFPGRFGMERHAQQCYSCGKTVADAQELSRKARECVRVPAPRDFEAAVMRRIQEGNARRGLSGALRSWFVGFEWPAWRLVAASASGLAVLGLGVILGFHFVPRFPAGSAPPEAAAKAAATPVPARTDVEPAASSAAPREVDTSPAQLVDLFSRKPDISEKPFVLESADPADSDYVECLVPGPGGRMIVARLPKTIRMRYGQPSERYFIRNVSH